MSHETIDISGSYQVTLADGSVFQARLPGTLDSNGIGQSDTCAQSWHPDVDLGNAADENTGLSLPGVITTRFTRRHVYSGKATFTRSVSLGKKEELEVRQGKKRIFLHLERSRALRCIFDGRQVSPYQAGTLSTEAVYELTDCFQQKNAVTEDASGSASCDAFTHSLALCVDNTYPGLPAAAITYSSAATDETQTNWNGIVGRLELELTAPTCINAVRAYPTDSDLQIQVDVDAKEACQALLTVESQALVNPARKEIALLPGRSTVMFYHLPLNRDARRWDEGEGNLYDVTVQLSADSSTGESKAECEKSAFFGIRSFKNEEGHFTLNGRPIFLRSEANCAVFPETGHLPMDEESWRAIFKTYASYGVNHLRFHSHCPPKAAFSAADKMGMLLQVELSNWDPKTAFESPEARSYYTLELISILRAYANHPSFVMLTLGNELHYASEQADFVSSLLLLAKKTDSSRLYANASNPFYGHQGPDEESGFYTSAVYKDQKIRGTGAGMTGYINNKAPGTKTNYEAALSVMRRDEAAAGKEAIPVVSFEVGQYEVLPDFSEISHFHGVTLPKNLEAVQKRVEEAGFAADWEKRVSASGELAVRCYREEVEAALRSSNPASSASLSGISLLGLQDFPGQGTALVGMLNSHLQPKPYPFAQPERFKQFFASSVLLAELDSYTYTVGESLSLGLLLAHYGKTELTGEPVISLHTAGRKEVAQAKLAKASIQPGSLARLGSAALSLAGLAAGAYTLELTFAGLKATYPIWLYEDFPCLPCSPEGAYEGVSIARSLQEGLSLLAAGKKVYLEPPATEENFPSSMETCFSTDFWSVGTFAFQSGYMGILTNPEHPIFASFPTAYHADWQWWQVTHKSRAFKLPPEYPSLIEAMDSYARLRRCALLAEFRCNGGNLLVSGMNLLEKQEQASCRALLHGILSYMSKNAFAPEKELDKNLLSAIIH